MSSRHQLSLAERHLASVRLSRRKNEVLDAAVGGDSAHICRNRMMPERQRVDAVLEQKALVVERAEAALPNLTNNIQN